MVRGFSEQFLGRHRWPLECCKSELKPMTGFFRLRTLLAATKKVPSPPTGITASAHATSSSLYVSLKMSAENFFKKSRPKVLRDKVWKF